MAENRKERDKRFYFSRGQMFMLGGAFTLAAITIFLLGMYVGKSIEARKMVKPDEPLLKFPVTPSAQAPAPPSAAPKEEAVVFENQAKVGLTQAAAEEKPKTAEPVVKAEPTKEAKSEAKEAQPKAVEKKVEKKADKAPEASKKSLAEESESKEIKDSGKNWRVQVNAFPDEQSAKQLVDRLKNKSYNAYVTEVRNKGKLWYRVSVGRYGSREEADKMLDTLKAKENFTKAFATTR